VSAKGPRSLGAGAGTSRLEAGTAARSGRPCCDIDQQARLVASDGGAVVRALQGLFEDLEVRLTAQVEAKCPVDIDLDLIGRG
jgi:hypothetical protein